MESDTRFWNATDRAEGRFTGTGDVARFRREMRRLGHDADTINERIKAIYPHLLAKETGRG